VDSKFFGYAVKHAKRDISSGEEALLAFFCVYNVRMGIAAKYMKMFWCLLYLERGVTVICLNTNRTSKTALLHSF
jgi:hypothetical protein